jgi:glycosyltransferase involved in cell wall biosynthesis
MTATISVVLATFNGERFLEEQLNSIAQQTRPPQELIVSDDGSTDNSIEIVKRFSRTAPFPVIVRHNTQRLGYRANFLAAVQNAKSDLIAFSDQDDYWLPEKLAHSAREMLDERVMLTCHNALLVDENRTPLYPLYQTHWKSVDARTLREPWKIPLGFSQLFRRRLVKYSKYWTASFDHYEPDKRMAHDQWFYFLATTLGRVNYLPDTLVQHRLHGANLYGHRRPERVGPVDRLGQVLIPWPDRFSDFAAAAANRAEIICRIALDAGDRDAGEMLSVAQRYRELARNYSRRDQLYADRRRAGKLKHIIELLRSDAYAADRLGGFGLRGFGRDFVRTVVLGQNHSIPRQRLAIRGEAATADRSREDIAGPRPRSNTR